VYIPFVLSKAGSSSLLNKAIQPYIFNKETAIVYVFNILKLLLLSIYILSY